MSQGSLKNELAGAAVALAAPKAHSQVGPALQGQKVTILPYTDGIYVMTLSVMHVRRRR